MRVLLIDDEALARKRLRQLLRGHSDIQIIGECSDGEAAVGAIREHKPDLIFLDVQMPEMNGFDVLTEIPSADRPLVIFVTAFDEYALRAFEIHALDYLLKPFDTERFAGTLERAREVMRLRGSRHDTTSLDGLLAQVAADQRTLLQAMERQASAETERLLVKSGSRIVAVQTSDIEWVEAAGNYARIHTSDSKHLVRESISNLESVLGKTRFARVHRSTIVNLDKIKELRPWFSGEMIIILQNGTELKLSRTYRRELEQRIRVLS